MAIAITLTKIDKRPNGEVWISWSDGTTQFFNSAEAVKAVGADFDDPAQGLDNARMLLVHWWLARSPDLSNTNLVVGKTLTLDLSAASPIRVQ